MRYTVLQSNGELSLLFYSASTAKIGLENQLYTRANPHRRRPYSDAWASISISVCTTASFTRAFLGESSWKAERKGKQTNDDEFEGF